MKRNRECIRVKDGIILEVLKTNPEELCGPTPAPAESDIIDRPCFLTFCGML